tara:strand:+ start:1423 stop:1824 length:402 start_codon:yes stop_codon:yes gene_type:complete
MPLSTSPSIHFIPSSKLTKALLKDEFVLLSPKAIPLNTAWSTLYPPVIAFIWFFKYLYLSKISVCINSFNGFVISISQFRPPNTVKYSIAVSRSFGLFFLQNELNCFFVAWSIKMMVNPLCYFQLFDILQKFI